MATNWVVTFPRAVLAWDITGVRRVFLLVAGLSSVFVSRAGLMVLASADICGQRYWRFQPDSDWSQL